jgi:hypothetical protein
MDAYEIRRNEIKKMWENNHTGKEIAIHFGITRNAVMGIVHRLISKGELLHKTPERQKTAYLNAMSRLKNKDRVEKEFRPVVKTIKRHKPISQPGYFGPVNKPENASTTNFDSITQFSCRYVVSGDTASNYMFCSELKTKRSYCDHHYSLCYTKRESKYKKVDDYTIKLKSRSVFLNY